MNCDGHTFIVVSTTVVCMLIIMFATMMRTWYSDRGSPKYSTPKSLPTSKIDRFSRLLDVTDFVNQYPGFISLNEVWNISSSSFCAGLKEYTEPIILDTMVSGLTNQLMRNQQSLFISASLGLPFESMGFLDVGCFSAWPNCPKNALIPISKVFDLDMVSMKLGIKWTQASKNYCYRHIFPPSLPLNQVSFNSSLFSIKGRTLMTPGWARYVTNGTRYSWNNFTKVLRSSLNHRIVYYCNAILQALPPFHCIHPRVDTDYIDKYDIGRKIINSASDKNTTFYVVMRENSRHMYPQPKVQ